MIFLLVIFVLGGWLFRLFPPIPPHLCYPSMSEAKFTNKKPHELVSWALEGLFLIVEECLASTPLLADKKKMKSQNEGTKGNTNQNPQKNWVLSEVRDWFDCFNWISAIVKMTKISVYFIIGTWLRFYSIMTSRDILRAVSYTHLTLPTIYSV